MDVDVPRAEAGARLSLASGGPWPWLLLGAPFIAFIPRVQFFSGHSAALMAATLAAIAAMHGALLMAWRRRLAVASVEALVPVATLLLLAMLIVSGGTKFPLPWVGVYLYVPVLAHLYRRSQTLTAAFFVTGVVVAAIEMKLRVSGTPNATLIANALVPPLLYLLFSADPERERRARAEIAASQEALERIRAEEKRLALAREVHDGIGAHLTAAAMQAEVAADTVTDEPLRARAALARLRRRITQAMEELSLLAEERQDTTVAVLIEELRAITEGIAQPCTWAFDARCEALDGFVPPATRLALRRGLQEGVANAVRHGRPQRIVVDLHVAGGSFQLDIADDGVGIAGTKIGFGRRSIAARMEAIGGTATWKPRPGGGTLLSLTLKVPAERSRVAA